MRTLLLILSLFTLISCSSMRSKDRLNEAPPAVKIQFQKAENSFKNRSYQKTLETLSAIIKKYRNTDVGDDALFLMARTYSKKEDWKKAYSAYKNIYGSDFYSPREVLARTSAAKILTYKLNRPKLALSLVDETLRLKNSSVQKADLLEVRFNALMKSGSQLEAFETLVLLSERHPIAAKRNIFKRKAKAFLDSRLSGPELKDFANDNKPSELKTDAMYRYGLHLVNEGNYSEARSYLNRVIQKNPKSYVAVQSQQLLQQLNARDKVDTRTVGVILPLSGKYSKIGYQTLWGLQLALGIKGGANTNNIRLAIIDSRGKPEYARRGVKRLVDENHVIAIVGGLLSKTAYSASIQAQEIGVPFVALSQKEGLTDIGPYIFRNALTIESQIDSLVKTSMKDLGIKRFAVLFPNDSYGVKISNIFWKTVSRNGGKVSGAQSYPPGETDFKEPIQKLVGTFYMEDRKQEYKKRLKEWYEKQGPNGRKRNKPPVGLLPPVVDFDAVFIPDGPRAIGQIAPMLAYNDVSKVYLIGTNIWNSREFLRRGQNFITKSLFTDGVYSKDENYINSNFYQNYSRVFGKAPSSFSLQGYDSGLVVQSALSSGTQTRVSFASQLKQNRGIPGALNTLMLNNKKEFIRPVVNLTVKDGEIVPFTVE